MLIILHNTGPESLSISGQGPRERRSGYVTLLFYLKAVNKDPAWLTLGLTGDLISQTRKLKRTRSQRLLQSWYSVVFKE